jgi:hypothetical protein
MYRQVFALGCALVLFVEVASVSLHSLAIMERLYESEKAKGELEYGLLRQCVTIAEKRMKAGEDIILVNSKWDECLGVAKKLSVLRKNQVNRIVS